MNNEVYTKLNDLKKIKKEYGENMSHLCRELFPTILEMEGLLYHILETHFAKSRNLYFDIINEEKKYQFKDYIYFLYDEIKGRNNNEENYRSVVELLKEKGYTLYECRTNEDIHRFRKYYNPREELCTFRDPNRINNHYIFFIVRDNADKLDRNSFTSPKREDEYSVSVLDLQFDKGARQRVSIKSRYNHTVSNPDATYSNNLENIAVGLTEAFERDYGFKKLNGYKVNFELSNYVQARDNRYYKYNNYEINNIHYCHNNIIIDNGEVIDKYTDKGRYTFMDYFILDEKEKKIILYDSRINDSFIDGLDNITNIEIKKENGYKKIILKQEENKEAIITLDSDGRIIEYENEYLKESRDYFLLYNRTLQKLNLPNLQNCGKGFLYSNEAIRELDLPNLQNCGDDFLFDNRTLQELNLPNLQNCGEGFLFGNNTLQKLNLPNLQACGKGFLYNNIEAIRELDLPNLQNCGDDFLFENYTLQKLNLPNLQACGKGFLFGNNTLQKLNLPNLQVCGKGFLFGNNILQELNLPKLQECGDNFLYCNRTLQELNLPNLQKSGDDFLPYNRTLQKLNLPNLQNCGNSFLFKNRTLQEINLPNLQACGDSFLSGNNTIQKLNLPNLQACGDDFLLDNNILQELNLPKLQECGDKFLCCNITLQELNLPKLRYTNNYINRLFELVEINKREGKKR